MVRANTAAKNSVGIICARGCARSVRIRIFSTTHYTGARFVEHAFWARIDAFVIARGIRHSKFESRARTDALLFSKVSIKHVALAIVDAVFSAEKNALIVAFVHAVLYAVVHSFFALVHAFAVLIVLVIKYKAARTFIVALCQLVLAVPNPVFAVRFGNTLE